MKNLIFWAGGVPINSEVPLKPWESSHESFRTYGQLAFEGQTVEKLVEDVKALVLQAERDTSGAKQVGEPFVTFIVHKEENKVNALHVAPGHELNLENFMDKK